MANFRADQYFDVRTFSLYAEIAPVTLAKFQLSDNGNRLVVGARYVDVAVYDTSFLTFNRSFYVGGNDLVVDNNHQFTGGTVTGLISTRSAAWAKPKDLNPVYKITDISLSASKLSEVAGTTAADDSVLLGSLLSGDDSIRLVSGGYMYGLGGNDTLIGGAGSDWFNGGGGNDRLIGGAGDDTLSYASDASLTGGVSSSLDGVGVKVDLRITAPQDTVGAGIDTISGFESLEGSSFDDELTGTNGDNFLRGGLGNDKVRGLGGNDHIWLEGGRDVVYGGSGSDTFEFHKYSATGDVPQIRDFAASDHLVFATDVFRNLPLISTTPPFLFRLDPSAFYAAPGAKAPHDADDRFVYDTTSGKLWYYDPDIELSSLVVTLTNKYALSAEDFGTFFRV